MAKIFIETNPESSGAIELQGFDLWFDNKNQRSASAKRKSWISTYGGHVLMVFSISGLFLAIMAS